MMAKPAFIFDGRLLYDTQKMRTIGFQVFSIGKGAALLTCISKSKMINGINKGNTINLIYM